MEFNNRKRMKFNLFDKYTLIARLYPTLLGLIPFFIMLYFFISKEIATFFNYLGNIKIISDITLTIVILYFLAQINRSIGKDFFEKRIFKDELNMPTTRFLLFSDNQYSKEYKKKIHDKIKKVFGIELNNSTKEQKDEKKSRQKITEAISLIRFNIGKGNLLHQHNIEYGFWRNLIGGSIIALLFSLINIYLSFRFENIFVLILSFLLVFIYSSLIIFSKYILEQRGKLYAKILLQEFMNKYK